MPLDAQLMQDLQAKATTLRTNQPEAQRATPDVTDVLDRAGYVTDYAAMSQAELDGRREQMAEVRQDLAFWYQRIEDLIRQLDRDINRFDRALLSVRGDDEMKGLE